MTTPPQPSPLTPPRTPLDRGFVVLGFVVIGCVGVLGGAEFAWGNAAAGVADLVLGFTWAMFLAQRRIWLASGYYQGVMAVLDWLRVHAGQAGQIAAMPAARWAGKKDFDGLGEGERRPLPQEKGW